MERVRGTGTLKGQLIMFTLYADGCKPQIFCTEKDAITTAHERGAEAFEIYNEDDRMVYNEFPAPKWV